MEMNAIPNMLNAFKTLRAGSPHHSMDLVAFLEEKLCQIRTILPRDAGDQRAFRHGDPFSRDNNPLARQSLLSRSAGFPFTQAGIL